MLGSGDALSIQLLTILAIAASVAFWVWAYGRWKVPLRPYALPIALWVVFGTLDIAITARGTLGDPTNEGNPLARWVFESSGYIGPVVASVLWISLWSFVVLVINKKITKRNGFVLFLSLVIFYSLAAGHFYGFSSWFAPMCGVAKLYGVVPELPRIVKIVIAGIAFAAAHVFMVKGGARFFKDM